MSTQHPPGPHVKLLSQSEPPTRGSMKEVSKTLSDLTADHGPIVQVVKEVQRGNDLAVSNQRSLRVTLGVMLVMFLSIGYSLYLLDRSANKVDALWMQQEKLAEAQKVFATETADKLRATQQAVDDSPKIIATETGELMFVTKIQLQPEAAKTARAATKARPAPSKSRRKRRKRAMRVDKSAVELPATIAIPLRTDEATYGSGR